MDEEKIDRNELKQQRKERKQLKKQAKRIEQQKEHERKYLEIKYGPKDQKVKLISNPPNTNNFNTTNTNAQFKFNIDNLDNNFPSLEQTAHLKNKSSKNHIPQLQTNNEVSSKRKKSSPLILNITEIISAPSNSNYKEETHSKNKTNREYGNSLDASQPIRLRGKHREIPKRKQPSKLKTQIISDSKLKISDSVRDGIHSASFETYCDHIVTDDLNSAVKTFLFDIVRFQEQLYKRDPIKGNTKRRYIVGMREVKKFVVIKKIKLIIIAPNIRTIVENGALDTAVQDLIALAKENEIPYIFALSRWKLGEITLKYRPISCIGIFDYSGTEEKYFDILNQSTNAKIAYANLLPTNEENLSDDETEEIVQKLVNICAS